MRAHALLLSFAALACRHATPAPSDRVEPRAQTAPHAAPEPITTADAATANDAATRRLSALADELTNRMGALRELRVTGPIARGVMSRDAVVERLRARTRQEYPPGELDLEGESLKRLGLIPASLDYERTMFDLLEEQVLGFYDPDERRLYIADWVPTEMQRPTMAHELTHALQDQHFNIGRFTRHVRGRGDAQTAAMAVLEGDATAAMFDFTLAPSGRTVLDLPDVTSADTGGASDDQPRLAAAPRALRESLLFPYVAGLRLCVERMRAGGHRAVDALLAHPPDSTEQVMHADRLASRDPPVEVPVEVPAPLAAEFELAYHDVLGEFGTALVLEEGLSDAQARAGAQGWGGDRAVLLLPRGSLTPGDAGVHIAEGALAQSALVWTLVMDPRPSHEDAEATELAGMLATILARRYTQGAQVTIAHATAARASGDGRVSLVATKGRTVVFADRVPAGRAAALVTTLLP